MKDKKDLIKVNAYDPFWNPEEGLPRGTYIIGHFDSTYQLISSNDEPILVLNNAPDDSYDDLPKQIKLIDAYWIPLSVRISTIEGWN